MIEYLEKLDRELFLFLNSFHSEFWDQIMLFISGKFEWVPLYIVLLIAIGVRYKRKSFWLLLGAAILITLSDQISVQVFKEGIERYRPCHNLDIQNSVHIVNNKCGGKFGFVSSHASNSFAIAVFVGLLLSRSRGKWPLFLLLFWALLVSYSRIYLGVHYPADIIGGALLGSLLAMGIYRFQMYFLNRKEYI